jgi:hypothetical protein
VIPRLSHVHKHLAPPIVNDCQWVLKDVETKTTREVRRSGPRDMDRLKTLHVRRTVRALVVSLETSSVPTSDSTLRCKIEMRASVYRWRCKLGRNNLTFDRHRHKPTSAGGLNKVFLSGQWMSVPELEIRHASDWNDDKP